MSEKKKIPLYLSDEMLRRVDAQCALENVPSRTAFLDQAIQFYLEYQSIQNGGALLPTAVSSAIEGRLGVMEDRMAALLFKQTVEMDMVMNVVSAAAEITPTELQALRSRCVKEVKQTNGKLSFADTLAYQEGE